MGELQTLEQHKGLTENSQHHLPGEEGLPQLTLKNQDSESSVLGLERVSRVEVRNTRLILSTDKSWASEKCLQGWAK